MAGEKLIGSVSVEGGLGVIKIPLDMIHELRVALQPCTCIAAKSNATLETRKRLDRALGKLQSGKIK
mgnify:CR=1 FL=1